MVGDVLSRCVIQTDQGGEAVVLFPNVSCKGINIMCKKCYIDVVQESCACNKKQTSYTNLTEMSIKLTNDKPVYYKPYREHTVNNNELKILLMNY